jgi:hypothetical protein
MGIAEFIIGPAEGRTRWLCSSYAPPGAAMKLLSSRFGRSGSLEDIGARALVRVTSWRPSSSAIGSSNPGDQLMPPSVLSNSICMPARAREEAAN